MMPAMDGFVVLWIVIVFVALSFGLVNTLVMAVFERVREIGLMLALGMAPRKILSQIVVEAILLLLLIGLAIGNVAAWATILPLESGIDLTVVGEGMQMFGAASVLYPALHLEDVALANVIVIVLGFLASLSPALAGLAIRTRGSHLEGVKMKPVRCVDLCKTYLQGEAEVVKALDGQRRPRDRRGRFRLPLFAVGRRQDHPAQRHRRARHTRQRRGVARRRAHRQPRQGGSLATAARAIGFVFQAYNLIPVLTARENIEFVMEVQGVPAAERLERSQAILEEVGLAGLGDRRPAEMSGGQQQRVAVARAIVSRPSLVLADEPTANLDSHSAEHLMELFVELNTKHGTTFIIATHDQRVMAYARRIRSDCWTGESSPTSGRKPE